MNGSSAIRYSDLLTWEGARQPSNLPKTVAFFSLLFISIAIIPSMAHLLELKQKMTLGRDEYVFVQQLYRGWGITGVFSVAAMVSTLVMAFLSRPIRGRYILCLLSFTSLLITQILFWMVTYPIDRLTNNWTNPNQDWMLSRMYWEYSHAANAAIGFIALLFLYGAVLWNESDEMGLV
jgi:hypothetical protein